MDSIDIRHRFQTGELQPSRQVLRVTVMVKGLRKNIIGQFDRGSCVYIKHTCCNHVFKKYFIIFR